MQSPELADAVPAVFWLDRLDAPEPEPPLTGRAETDFAIVGGGFTGLWAAIQAKEDDPGREVVVLEAETIAFGASGRNGGFADASLTHGLLNGIAHFPRDARRLHELGHQNFAGIEQALTRYGIDADWTTSGDLTVARRPHEADDLREAAELLAAYGEAVELFDREGVRAQLDSPTFLAGLWCRTGKAIVDPARLAWGLRRAALELGVGIHEHTSVRRLRSRGDAVVLDCGPGQLTARHVLLATSAYPPLARSIRRYVAPVYDYALMTEPLSPAQLASIGWSSRQGVSDAASRFHYYRLTADDRILWGGYEAVYYRGGDVGPHRDQSPAMFEILAANFAETFPQLEGLRFTHRWGGAIDTCSRFCVMFGKAHRGRVAYAVGYTGLGVASTRFGARVALDLLGPGETELTRLELVRSKPLPFPPKPLRGPAIALTRRAMIRADENGGQRGPWLRFLDRLGAGFDS